MTGRDAPPPDGGSRGAGPGPAGGHRRGRVRGRHAVPAPVGRGSVVVRVLVCAALTLTGVLLAVTPQDGASIVDVPARPTVRATAVVGAGLVVLGWAPLVDLLVRRRADLRSTAGVWAARVAPAVPVAAAAALAVGCLVEPARRMAVPVVPVLLLAQSAVLAILWRRSP